MLQWPRIRRNVYKIFVFCLFLQPLFTSPVSALEGNASAVLAIPAITAPSNGSPHNTVRAITDFSFNWSKVTSQSVTGYQLRISRDEAQVGEAPDSSGAWYSETLMAATLPASDVPLHDGIWYWQVRALGTDTKSAWSDVWKVKIDTTGPMLSIAAPLESTVGKQAIAFSADATDSDGITSLTVELDGQIITDQVDQMPSENGTHLSKNWAIGELGDGNHSLKITAIDALARKSELTRTFKIDTAPPEMTISLTDNQIVGGVVPLEIKANEAGAYTIRITSDQKEILVMDDNTEPEAESSFGSMHSWNTWEVPDGNYIITFIGKDTVGNEVTVARQVTVDNMVATGVITKDPLLEALSAQLSQPIVVPSQPITSPPAPTVSEPPKVDDLSPEQTLLLQTVPEFTPVAATENGWKLFGILWYWWLLGGLVLASGIIMTKRLLRTSPWQIPDSV